jgi:hypothetical protein
METRDETQEPERHEEPDEDAQPAVEPVEMDQGEQVSEQEPQQTAGQSGFDPNQAVATSPPPPGAQSGVPPLEGGGNEGVEAQEEYRGPVEQGQGDEEDDEGQRDEEHSQQQSGAG